MNVKNNLKLLIIFMIVGFLIGPKIFANQKDKAELNTNNANQVASNETSSSTEEKADPFINTKLIAQSAFVYDIADRKILFSKDGETKRPLASITKVMTAVTALETRKVTDTIAITGEDLATEGDDGLKENEKWSLNNILALTLIKSSNDGATAIAASVGSAINPNSESHDDEVKTFVNQMNAKSKELELNSFYFTTPSGLDIGNTPGGVGSAHDVSRLFEYVLRKHSNLLQYTALPETKLVSKDKVVHRVVNTNEIAEVIPGIIGGKTGFTDLAGGNLAVVVDVGIQHPVAIVVLGSTKEKRFTDVEELLKRTQLAIAN